MQGPLDPMLRLPSIGERVQTLRKRDRLTLNDLAGRAGISASAVSKIENGQTSPTYETIVRLAVGLSVDVAELFGSEGSTPVSGRRAITRAGEGVAQSTPHYDYQMLCTDLATTAFIPFLTRIRARSVAEFAGLQSHRGEEFFYVLDGAVELHTEHYAPVRLDRGDSSYFDSGMGHALISVSPEEATVLWIATRVHGVLER
ncbi:helix-turn-helix domain-containing protein [Pseudooceanicola nanhaiensis]|uniref:helix-turn-helix domain-containing protein n=1 Tax=Pseudooceanicola nanhaiensis TaxID=375761 RepID=UPI001CD34C17|nr:XRE family transcriptional regulator [Pseudooceanicola nanhaiensis]MCA0921873.1 XRE family transcriptional regulator [Pseudooceanicola nanhaiensis]